MIVLTGGAGFIGSGMLARLNQAGIGDVLVVDAYRDALMRRNLAGKRYRKMLSPASFLSQIKRGKLKGKVSALIHMGACSSTTENDASYLMSNNLGYSIEVVRWALEKRARVIYASSAATYGGGEQGYSDDPARLHRLRPLNLYGWSKQLFDIWVEREGLAKSVLGLKFFNVFGPNEQHKGEMRSLVDKAFHQIKKEGTIRLFMSHKKGIGHGEQTRDFIYVKDVCGLMMDALKRPKLNGIFNLGSGRARNWNDLAKAVFSSMDRKPHIQYIPMPQVLRGKYQYHTQADMRRFFAAAGPRTFTPLEDAVADYVRGHLVPAKSW